jgi:hypothetical protein
LQHKLEAGDNGIMHYRHKITIKPSPSPLVTICFGFQKHARNTHASSNNVGLDHIRFNIVYLTIQQILVIVDKFDPNPILVNINKLKPYRFQDIATSRGLESTIERGRDTTNTKIGFNVATLEVHKVHAQNFHFQWMELKSKSHDLEPKTKIQ